MLTKRVIPCLDVRDGRVVQGKKFQGIIDVGDPEVLGEFYSRSGADELVFYDITATHEAREISLEFIERVAAKINIPFCVGGGVNNLADFRKILGRGADKVSVNSAAVKNPKLITEASLTYGAQCVVVSMDVKESATGKWTIFVNGGRTDTGIDAITWAREAVKRGAGELVINSIDADGGKRGYDIEFLQAVTETVDVPVIASGGAGQLGDFSEAVLQANVDGVLGASVFHYKEFAIRDVKEHMRAEGIAVRM